MFTGLIEGVCKIKNIQIGVGSAVIDVDLGWLVSDGRIGDSIAVNGTCLTITRINGSIASFDVSSETIEKSNIATLSAGAEVNVERALKASDRLGGHFVQGHIDAAATLEQVSENNDFYELTFSAAQEVLSQMIKKGSVAINGISLTIANLDESSFSVAIIPQTWQNTNLKNLKSGDRVNIETDIITKTVIKQLDRILPQKTSLTIEKLREMGF
ncbi:MAG: riboflavin synthase [Phycisphaerae bacterium]|nr:riboflavin synthase [Phycisphaerae bacterium]